MIDPAIVRQVERLLGEGRYSQRKIARMTGVSRDTVHAIASGKRPDYEARQQEAAERGDAPFSGPPHRCPGCGRLVLMPCLACLIAREKAAGRLKRAHTGPDQAPPDLDLRPGDRARYDEIRGGDEARGGVTR